MVLKYIRSFIKRIWFNWAYLINSPWDSGVPAPEVVAFVSEQTPNPVRAALDLGCGTGTNVVYLARQDWKVDGVDFSVLAIRQARRKIRRISHKENLDVNLILGDVTRLGDLSLRVPFDFVLDIGCLHSLGEERAAHHYVKGLKTVMKPGGFYLLYAHHPGQEFNGFPEHGLTKDWVAELFVPDFNVVEYRPGVEGSRGSAWYFLQKVLE